MTATPRRPADKAANRVRTYLATLRSVGSSRYAKIALAVSGGLALLVASFGLQNTPAYGPTGTLAQQVAPERAMRVVQPAPPTTTDQEPVETTSTTLNPNATFVSGALGDDGNDGSSLDNPIRSLQLALDQVEPGETVYLMDGTYRDLLEPGNAHYLARNGGTPDAWVTIQNAPGHSPVIIASDGNGLEVQADYVEVAGLTVRGEGYDETSDPWGNALLVRNSNHVRLVGNTLSNMPTSGISAVESANLAILNNEVFENAFWSSVQGSGISLWHSSTNGEPPDPDGYHDRILGNRIYRNENKVKSRWKDFAVITDGNGIIIDEGRDTVYTGRVLVANNVIFDNGGRAVMVYKTNNVDVMFNTTYNNGRTASLDGGRGELVAGQATNVRFLNNLVWPAPGLPGLLVSSAENVETEGNLVVTDGDAGDVSGRDAVQSDDPGLRNPSISENEADFRPLVGSAAIGRAAEVSPLLTYDYNGLDRDAAEAAVGAHGVFDG